MFKPNQSNEKDYKISMKAKSGNTVAFINLRQQFCKKITGTTTPTFEQVSKINKNDLVSYLVGLDITLEQLVDEPTQDASDF